MAHLATEDAHARLALGTIAAVLLRRRAYQRLSFVRVSDYSRERLGLCASQLYALVRVSEALRGLPETTAAFVSGSIGWTKVRELVDIVQPNDEDEWLAVARTHTAEQLRALLRQAQEHRRDAELVPPIAGGSSSVAGQPGRAVTPPFASDDDNEIDGEPILTFRISCPRYVKRLWHAALELARRVAGSDLPSWEAAECVAAEALSASGWSELGNEASALRADSKTCATSLARKPRGVSRERDAQGNPTQKLSLLQAKAQIGCELRSSMRAAVAEDESFANLLRDLEDADAHELDRRMRDVVAAMQALHGRMGRALATVNESRAYKIFGYASVASYAHSRLGLCCRTLRGLLALERAANDGATALMESYRSGALGWYRCLMLLPVIDRTNACDWVARAQRVTARRLRDEIEWALAHRIPGESVIPPVEGSSLDLLDAVVDRNGKKVPSIAGPSADVRANVRQIGAHDDAPDIAFRAALDREINFRGPASVVALLNFAITSYGVPARPRWFALEAVLKHAIQCWRALPKHRDPVFDRDGWRCGVPACSSRRNLEDHHIVFRSRGGGNERDNRVSVCAAHHIHAIHHGTMRATGTISRGLLWELGLRRDGTPLMALIGDSYAGVPQYGTSIEPRLLEARAC